MSFSIADLYKYAKLSTTTYIIPPNSQNPDNPIHDKKFSDYLPDYLIASQAQNRAPMALAEQMFGTKAEWTIPQGGLRGNDTDGFAATLYQSTDDSTVKVLAIRGTEPSLPADNAMEDLIKADALGIGLDGFASYQTIQMINYIEQAKAGQGESYKVYKLDMIHSADPDEIAAIENNPDIHIMQTMVEEQDDQLATPRYFYTIMTCETKVSDKEAIIKAGDQITLTGHSLGGHLAVMAKRLYPDLFDEVYHYNAPGFNPKTASLSSISLGVLGSLINPMLGLVTSALLAGGGLTSKYQFTEEFINVFRGFGNNPAASFESLANSLHGIESEDLTLGDDISIVSSIITGATMYGDKQNIPVEYNSHLVAPIMDVLALINLLNDIMPVENDTKVRLEEFTQLFATITTDDSRTLEILTESLLKLMGKLLQKPLKTAYANEGLTDMWSGAGDPAARQDYYERGLLPLEEVIKAHPAIEFKLLTGDLSKINFDEKTELGLAYRYALINLNPFAIVGADYTNFNKNGELDLYDPTTGKGQITEAYLKARSALLAGIISSNSLNDEEFQADSFYNLNDKTLGRESKIHIHNETEEAMYVNRIIFGLDTDDSGDEAIDVSYNDTTGSMNSFVFSGNGDDTIIMGGIGSDYVEGGVGDDQYIVKQGGNHKIFDLDGDGSVTYKGQVLKFDQPHLWRLLATGGARWIYDDRWIVEIVDNEKGGRDLVIKDSKTTNESLTIVNYKEGSLEISSFESLVNKMVIASGVDLQTALQKPDANPLLNSQSGAPTTSVQDWEGGYANFAIYFRTPPKEGEIIRFNLGGTIPDGMVVQISNKVYEVKNGQIVFTIAADSLAYGGGLMIVLMTPQFFKKDAALNVSISYEDKKGATSTVTANFNLKGDENEATEKEDNTEIEFVPTLPEGGSYNTIEIEYKPSEYDENGNVIFKGDLDENGLPYEATKGTGGNDLVIGTEYDDWVVLKEGGDDRFNGDQGNDGVLGGSGADILIGDGGRDVLLGGGGDDFLFADQYRELTEDVIKELKEGTGKGSGGLGDSLNGMDGEDLLIGSNADDALFGGADDDVILGCAGDDIIHGDRNVALNAPLWFLNSDNQWVESSQDRYHWSWAENKQHITIGGNDILYGGAGKDRIYGDAGNDFIDGGDADDLISGGSHDDVIYGGDGNDQIYGDESWEKTSESDLEKIIHGNDIIHGGAGDDVIVGNGGDDLLLGEDGDDIIYGGQFVETANEETDEKYLGNDYLSGGKGDDGLLGGAGNDILLGGEGRDVLLGGAGNDFLFAEDYIELTSATLKILQEGKGQGTGKWGEWLNGMDGQDTLVGNSGNDALFGGAGNDLVMGGAGDDYIHGDRSLAINSPLWHLSTDNYWVETDRNRYQWDWSGNKAYLIIGGNDRLHGGAGNDRIWGDAGNDFIDGGEGDDWISGGSHDDAILGGVGDDTLNGDEEWAHGGASQIEKLIHGNDVIHGGEGNDVIVGNGGNDQLFGDEGNDTIYGDQAARSADRTFDEKYYGNDYLSGGEGNDYLVGGGKDDELHGGEGNNELHGDEVFYDGKMYLDGKLHGKDKLYGGNGNDRISGGGNDDIIYAGDGDDIIFGDLDVVTSEQIEADKDFKYHGNDYIDGGAGNDGIFGGAGNDFILGGAGNDIIAGDANNVFQEYTDGTFDDTIDGGEGDDIIAGGQGNDILLGGAGNDHIYGDSGEPNHEYTYGTFDDTIDGGEGDDVILGGQGSDIIHGSQGNDRIYGDSDGNTHFSHEGNHDDVIYGDEGDDEIHGGQGNDLLYGGVGNDTIVGDEGDDFLSGGDGDDILIDESGQNIFHGGKGFDRFKGGSEQDTYIFNLGDAQGKKIDNSDGYLFESIADVSNNNILKFGVGITKESLKFYKLSGKIFIKYSQNDGVFIDENIIERIIFSDGTNYSYNELLEKDDSNNSGGTGGNTGTGGSNGSSGGGIIEPEDKPANYNQYILGQQSGVIRYELIIGYTPITTDGSRQPIIIGWSVIHEYDGFNIPPAVYSKEVPTQFAYVDEVFSLALPTGYFIDVDNDKLTYTLKNTRYYPYPNNWLQLNVTNNEFNMAGINNQQGNTYFELTANDGRGGTASLNFDVVAGIRKEQQRADRADIIIGNQGGDVIVAGNEDSVYGRDGNDTITIGNAGTAIGGKGDDHFYLSGNYGSFNGGEGVDTYYVLKDQSIVISDNDRNNILKLGEGLRKEDMRLQVSYPWGDMVIPNTMQEVWEYMRSGGNLVISFKGSNTTIKLEKSNKNSPLNSYHLFKEIHFADGEVMNGQNLGIASFSDRHNYNFVESNQNFLINQYPVYDPEVGFTNGVGLTFLEARLEDGSPLPEWMKFDVTTGSISGIPPFFKEWTDFTITIKVRDKDGVDGYFETYLSIPASSDNHAPEIAKQQQDISHNQNDLFIYQIPHDLFRDADAADILNYRITLTNGDPLPAWLSYDAASRTLMGIPDNDQVGNLQLKIIATDPAGLSAEQSFNLTVNNVNDAPVANGTLNAQTGKINELWQFDLPVSSFTDIDLGDSLSYSLRMVDGSAVPVWLKIDATTGKISGTPSNASILNLQIVATDLSGAQAIHTLKVDIKGGYNPGDIVGTDGNETLTGTNNNDVFYGLGGDDRMIGSDGSDAYIFAKGHGQDVIYDYGYSSATETDTLIFTDVNSTEVKFGRSGNNLVLFGYNGSDKITIEHFFTSTQYSYAIEAFQFADKTITYDDYMAQGLPLYALDATSTITGWSGANIIHAGSGTKTINTSDANDVIYTETANVTVNAGNGNDTIYSGSGNDRLIGSNGSDTYIFAKGHGQDVIYDYGYSSATETDTLIFTDVNSTEVKFGRSGNNLVLFGYNGSDKITIEHFFTSTQYSYAIEAFQFADKTITYDQYMAQGLPLYALDATSTITGWSGANIIHAGNGTKTINTSDANDVIYTETANVTVNAGNGNDTIYSGSGNDRLIGSNGSDTYIFAKGHGQDVIYDYGYSSATDTDTLTFTDVNSTDVKFGRSGNNLVLFGYNGSDRITIEHFFTSTPYSYAIEAFKFADKTITYDDYMAQGLPLYALDATSTITGWSGANIIHAGSGTKNITTGNANNVIYTESSSGTVTAGKGQDTFYSGSGNSRLVGDDGSDTYIFAKGHGQDVIYDYGYSSATDTDTLSFNDVNSTDVKFGRSGNNLVLFGYNGSDKITIEHFFTSTPYSYAIEAFQFADKTITYDELMKTSIPAFTAEDQANLLAAQAELDAITALNQVMSPASYSMADSLSSSLVSNQTLSLTDTMNSSEAQADIAKEVQSLISAMASFGVTEGSIQVEDQTYGYLTPITVPHY